MMAAFDTRLGPRMSRTKAKFTASRTVGISLHFASKRMAPADGDCRSSRTVDVLLGQDARLVAGDVDQVRPNDIVVWKDLVTRARWVPPAMSEVYNRPARG